MTSSSVKQDQLGEQRAVERRILVVEDDPSIQLGLRMVLEREGYEVCVAEDGEAGLERIQRDPWDLVILDVMLPKLNGYEVLGRVRKLGLDVKVLVLSARTSDSDKVMGLDLGADDYVSKPFSVPELLARVRAALRRHEGAATVTFGTVVVDAARREVTRDGVLVQLTATEFSVLWLLINAHGRVLTREQIFEGVWGAAHHGTHRTIDNFVAQLRNKIEDDPIEPRHLVTVRGVGYRFAQ
ncbi:MAG: response regulator transcription factor [Myxococcales bacterium]|nr:response regulator transcription factor [Myxococcales bacterium]